MPKVSWQMISSAVLFLLLCVPLMCNRSEVVHAESSNSKGVQLPQGVEVLVPQKTHVEVNGEAESQTRDFFSSPSLVQAGGVLVAFAEGRTQYTGLHHEHASWLTYADIVAGYINAVEPWSSFVAEVNANKWKAHTVFIRGAKKRGNVGRALLPTAVAKGNKVFLLVGSHEATYNATAKSWDKVSRQLDLLVGEATQDKVIQWGKPTSLLRITQPANQRGLKDFYGAGGSGVVMEDGTLVFPLLVRRSKKDFVSMIMYSRDDGKNWVLPKGTSPADCIDPLIVEWEQGQLVMVAKCNSLSNVFESRDMGETWTEAVRILTRVHPMFLPNPSRAAEGMTSFTTATIAGKKVMLYTQKRIPPAKRNVTSLYLWVTDNNRTFHLGPISMDTTEKPMLANTLLHSTEGLHLLRERGSRPARRLVITPLTEELKTVRSVVETWARLEARKGDGCLRESVSRALGLLGLCGVVFLL
ncbi:group II trans-sialidase superfamily [Trypanosoma rangeli]|uniref:Group II trans-sialidase superfamily n=1 Tax=Trypanosoma rangeli TaxID=5698 RepID=A0A3R7JT78_TRYRA|nr:group II trans-sialidase superfamily [Trypanosoma rangeli]RNE96485.1 group II trans-sialidase superfamily [Trypanosoma rangeli]|eukprot:RNE96485.1 group II trans-sialidase superfamily [Trypanosoma rangeli]